MTTHAIYGPDDCSRVLMAFWGGLYASVGVAHRGELEQLAPLMGGTADRLDDEARVYLALDWLVRTYTPAWLELAGLTAAARSLRDLDRVVDPVTARSAAPVVRAACDRALEWRDGGPLGPARVFWVVRDVAAPAVEATSQGAPWVTADAAAGAVLLAATTAAETATGAAGVTRDAVHEWLQPTVDALQNSAVALFRAMIRPEVTA
jgi:hypothetical protein